MKLLLIVDDYLPYSKKVAAKMMHELAVQFYQNGHSVTVITPFHEVKKNYNTNLLDGVKIIYFKSGKLNTYSTIYNIDPNHFNAFFRPIVKFFRSFLTKFFFYGQFWVKGEFNEIKINRDKDEIFLTGKNKNSNSERINLINSLDKIGLKVFKILKLKFAYGFHYHSLRVNYKGKNETINNFLKNMKLNKEVLCFDSSIIKKISLKPPTKTFLATANYLVKKFKN